MTKQVERHHWLNTIVGILDTAFLLTDEEQFAVAGIVRDLLAALRIPERGPSDTLPVPVAQEAESGFYSLGLAGPRESGVVRRPRPVTPVDVVVSLDAWREALVGLITTAYPHLTGDEKLLLSKVINDLLAAIGAPARAVTFFPDAVVRAYREIDIA